MYLILYCYLAVFKFCSVPLKWSKSIIYVLGFLDFRMYMSFTPILAHLSVHSPPPLHPPGDPLQWLPEDSSVQSGHVTFWGLLPERGFGGCGSLFTTERCDRDQTAQQHVYVQSQSGHEAHLPWLQVHPCSHSAVHVWYLLRCCKAKTF